MRHAHVNSKVRMRMGVWVWVWVWATGESVVLLCERGPRRISESCWDVQLSLWYIKNRFKQPGEVLRIEMLFVESKEIRSPQRLPSYVVAVFSVCIVSSQTRDTRYLALQMLSKWTLSQKCNTESFWYHENNYFWKLLITVGLGEEGWLVEWLV